MAVVWYARRADGAFKRFLALKIPMPAGRRGDLAHRFARECDILAGLEHPHIARLYDAGVDAGGLPYLALEYVEGRPLTDWCDERRLGLRERLLLFMQVLDAVQYAHARQVVHRDLKPSNILVTDDGQARLLDFGVAKLIADREEDADASLTARFGPAGTPSYASPEQVRGEPVSAAADVYALGVVLYELLTGSRPYVVKAGGSPAQLAQTIENARVERPSERVKNVDEPARRATPHQIAWPSDALDAIVSKAMARAPEDRHSSARAFAEELQSVLVGEPIKVEGSGLFGRETDLAALHPLLDAHRLVTLLGAGGIGKTALALAVAHEQAGRHADGVKWVDLTTLTSPRSLVSSLAVAVGVALATETAQALAQALAASRMLIVLDNCEHVAADLALLLAPLLTSAPEVSWLATSQEALALPGEHAYRLQGLAVPPTGASLDEALSFGAFRLLEERARQVDQRFSIDGPELEAAIDICHQLDGIALAIEMAAARLPALGVHAVRANLDQRLRWLSNRNRSAPTRQQTLRTTLDWSHSLLNAAEQRTLRRLAAFAGSFTLELVQQVVPDEDLDEWSMLDAICALADRSLVRVESTQPVRYRLLESMRFFAIERLAEAGEADAIAARHAAVLSALAHQLLAAYDEQPEAEVLRVYDPCYADLDKAFNHVCALRDGDLAGELLTGLRLLVQLRGDVLTMEPRLRAAQPLLDSASPRARARLLTAMASCGWVHSLKLSPRAAAAQAVDAWRAVGGNVKSLHSALLLHATGLAQDGEADAAQRVLAEAQRLETSDFSPMKRLHSAAHAVFVAGQSDDAEMLRDNVTAAVSLAHALGAERLAAQMEAWLPRAALLAGDFEQAISLAEAAIVRLRELRLQDLLPTAMDPLLSALLSSGHWERARRIALEWWSQETEGNRIFLVGPIARLAFHQRQPAVAARLRGYVDACLSSRALVRTPDEERLMVAVDTAIESEAGTDTFRDWHDEGARFGVAEVEAIVKKLLMAEPK